MSDNSPLFVSAIELLAHATEIFAQGNAKKYKFVILHLANAVELILKDYVIDQGISIYNKGQNTTITIWKCLELLETKSIDIPERPVLELLIDDRNTIQHRFGYPDEISVYYYLDKVVAFFQRFLDVHYAVKLNDALEPHLSNPNLELIGLVKGEYDYLEQLMKISPEAAIVHAYPIIEKKIIEIIGKYLPSLRGLIPRLFAGDPNLKKLLDDLEQKKFVQPGIYDRFKKLRVLRNAAAHNPIANRKKHDLEEGFEIAKELIHGLQKAQETGYTFVPYEKNDNGESSSN